MQESNNKFILSVVGTADYEEVCYRLPGEELSSPVKHFVKCLHFRFPDHKPILLMTEEAREKHLGSFSEDYEILQIKTGGQVEEVWEMFRDISDRFPEDSELIIDITNGLRHLPLMLLSTAVYLRAIKRISITHIYYGAYEARDDSRRVPVFDLSPFLDLMDWVWASGYYRERGDATYLQHLLRQQPEGMEFSKNQQQLLKDTARQMQDLSRAEALCRPATVAIKARKLNQSLGDLLGAQTDLPHIHPFLFTLGLIQQRVQPLLRSEQNLPKEELMLQCGMIRNYLQTRNFPLAIALTRETFLSIACLRSDIDPKNHAQRRDLSRELKEGAAQGFEACQSDWEALTKARNDLSHPGPENPQGSLSKAEKELTGLCKKFLKDIENHLRSNHEE